MTPSRSGTRCPPNQRRPPATRRRQPANCGCTVKVTFCVRGVVSPLLSNILLTPFDKEMRHKGYQLTRWADDWVVTCRTRAEADSALTQATKILGKLGVTLNREKTRIVHIAQGFEVLGFKTVRRIARIKLSYPPMTAKINHRNLL